MKNKATMTRYHVIKLTDYQLRVCIHIVNEVRLQLKEKGYATETINNILFKLLDKLP